jgi:hypothetical protein
VPWQRDFSILQFSSPHKNLLLTSRHFGLLQNSLTANYYGKRNGQHFFASQTCILEYNVQIQSGYRLKINFSVAVDEANFSNCCSKRFACTWSCCAHDVNLPVIERPADCFALLQNATVVYCITTIATYAYIINPGQPLPAHILVDK